MAQDLKSKQIIYPGKVIDSDDPQKLGRIRATVEYAQINNQYRIPPEKLDPETKDIKDKYKWTREDPFVFLPLLPFFSNLHPKPKEYVHIIFGNVEYPQQNKFYIPGVFSSPTAINFQNFEESKTFLSDGANNKEEKPIQSIDPLSGAKTDSYGVFPESVDNAFLGRGSADLILKENTSILRAGKSQIQRGFPPVANNRRAFLELDWFESQQSTDEKKQKRLIQEPNVQLIRFLIEFLIYNPDNKANPRAYTGKIQIFKLPADKRCNTKNFAQESDIEDIKPAPFYEVEFKAISEPKLIDLINQFVKSFNDGTILENFPDTQIILPWASGTGVIRVQNNFPFYFRLHPVNYGQLYGSNTATEVKTNLGSICKGINPFNQNSSGLTYFGLVSSKNFLGPTTNIKIEEFNAINYVKRPITYGLLGADELYLLSHKSQIPGKKKIAIDKSIYGYEQDQIGIDINENTNSMVRGEKLLELLNLIVKFLNSHVHPYHGLPPSPKSIDGTETSQLLKEMNEANFTILNKNIRIN
jgi:hypothetical protein